MSLRVSTGVVRKWNFGEIERLGLFKPQSRIRAPPPICREWKPFYIRLRELHERQRRAPTSPWTEELSRAERRFRYPIDNEMGKADTLERNATFADHIDFDEYLQWVPKSGPVAAFMDSVVLGLSKNHTRTVKEKRKIIRNFRNHFANFVDDSHLFPAEDVERARAEFAKIEGETPKLETFLENVQPVYKKGVGRVATPFKKFRKKRK